MKKILIVFGTRPEAIKMAPLIKEFQKYPDKILTKVCVTAQHREMLDQVLQFFEITPDYDLDIMRRGQDLYDITSRVLLGMKDILAQYQPDIVFVHGDTSTTFAASLAAFYQQISVAHIEAGLRTGDIYSPWPEEANRQLTSQITEYHFTPTETTKNNLINENICKSKITVTGNTVIDALLSALEMINRKKTLKTSIINAFKEMGIQFNPDKKYMLVTGHRRENHGKGFINICNALKEIAIKNTNIDIIYPVHLNPKVQVPVKDLLSGINNIHLINPLEYEHFIYLMDNCYIILTDSGGIQEEAPSLGKPVLVMRDTTERPEALKAGTVKLVGTDSDEIIKQVQDLINNKEEYKMMSFAHNPYGNGYASKKIVNFFLENFENN